MADSKDRPRLFEERFLRQIDQLVLVSKRLRAGQMQGERRSIKRGQSVEFADYRQYSRGDDFRLIDWNVYARLETLFLKLFVEEEDLTVHLLVDTSRSMDWGTPNKFLVARQVAGALGYIALAGLDRVTASTFGGDVTVFPPRRGKQQAHYLFEFLLGLQAGGTATLGSTLKRYAEGARYAGPLILISDLFDPTWQEGLRALLTRRFDVTVLHLLSPEEISPALAGDVRLRDVERGTELELTVDAAMLQRYNDNLQAWQGELRRWCGARGIGYATLSSDIPVEEITLNLLRRQHVLR
ncbi:MAG: DUF58 domain-containing protein [Ardenticatenales bacterium]|nr:DUF58 domain-containing protein [Ardenticatenales bacterium]